MPPHRRSLRERERWQGQKIESFKETKVEGSRALDVRSSQMRQDPRSSSGPKARQKEDSPPGLCQPKEMCTEIGPAMCVQTSLSH